MKANTLFVWLVICNFLSNRKMLLRLMAVIVISGHAIGPIIGPFSYHVEFSEMRMIDLLIIISSATFGISFFVFWGYTFYHWRTTEFKSKVVRRTWSVVVVLGGFAFSVGPLIYYITVVELGKGGKMAREPSA